MSSLTWRWYLVCGVLLTGCFPFLATALAQDAVYLAIGSSSVVAIAVGVRAHRPAEPWPWYLMLAGLADWVAGDAVDSWQRDIAHLDAYPSVVDAFYLSAYPIIAVGLWKLYRGRRAQSDRAGLVDAAILTVGAGVLSWAALGHPTIGLYQSSPLTALVSAAYPAGDILLLAMLFRMITYGGGRTVAFSLLVGAFALLIVGDTVETAASLWLTTGNTGYDVIWLLSYLVWGAAALHPSMARLCDRSTPSASVLSGRRLAALALAACVSPSVLVAETLTGTALDIGAVAGGSVVVFVLVVVRMKMAVNSVVTATAARDRLQDDLAYQATHDALTGLPNRAQAMVEIRAAQARAQRSGALLVLLFVDLDGFKAVNDSRGHAARDAVLCEVADRLVRQVRGGDLVARLGGDEFVVLLENVGGEAEAVGIGHRIVESASRPVGIGAGADVQVGASVGLAVSQDGLIDPDRLLNDADIAVYRAKRAGKARVEVFDDALRRELAHREVLEADLGAAIAADDLVVHYQPILDLASGRIRGYEALVRWCRSAAELVPPDEFIPLAEQSDLICDLDTWVLHTATAQVATLADLECTVAVNISGRHVSSPRVVDDVRSALDRSGLRPQRLVVEITETAFSNDLRAAEHLARLRRLGVTVSLDDFGTGYSSIARLRHLPADEIKIDRSFVAADSDSDRALLEVMIRAAHTAGFSVVAEGVETPAQLMTLRGFGCESAQGYLISRPVSFEQLHVEARRAS